MIECSKWYLYYYSCLGIWQPQQIEEYKKETIVLHKILCNSQKENQHFLSYKTLTFRRRTWILFQTTGWCRRICSWWIEKHIPVYVACLLFVIPFSIALLCHPTMKGKGSTTSSSLQPLPVCSQKRKITHAVGQIYNIYLYISKVNDSLKSGILWQPGYTFEGGRYLSHM